MAAERAHLSELGVGSVLAVQRFKDSLGRHSSREWKVPRSQSFRHRQNVRLHTPVLESKKLSGPSEASDHFVENQKYAVAVTDLSRARKISFGRWKDAA